MKKYGINQSKNMLYNKLKVGDRVYDPSMESHGIVKDIPDIHNVYVEYDEHSGGGLYCMDPECEDFDPSLKLINMENND